MNGFVIFKMTCLLVTLISKKGEQSLIFNIKKRFTTHVEVLSVLTIKQIAKYNEAAKEYLASLEE